MDKMRIFELVNTVVLGLVVLDFFINRTTLTNRPMFFGVDKDHAFKSIWHKHYHDFVGVLVVICAVGIVIKWLVRWLG